MRLTPGPYAVRLRDIPGEGLHKGWDLAGGFAEQTLKDVEGLRAEHLTGAVDLQRTENQVYARGSVRGSVTVPCSRCVKDAHVAVDVKFEMSFLPRDEAEDEAVAEEIELDPDRIDITYYDEDIIDLEQTMREELLLAVPLAPLCDEDCKGLCARCGKDLNEGPCDCAPEPRDDRWAALKNVKV